MYILLHRNVYVCISESLNPLCSASICENIKFILFLQKGFPKKTEKPKNLDLFYLRREYESFAYTTIKFLKNYFVYYNMCTSIWRHDVHDQFFSRNISSLSRNKNKLLYDVSNNIKSTCIRDTFYSHANLYGYNLYVKYFQDGISCIYMYIYICML